MCDVQDMINDETEISIANGVYRCRCNACVAERMSVCDNKQIVISILAVN